MKTPIAFALLCASLLSCQASDQESTQSAISASTDFLPMSAETDASIDTNILIEPIVFTSPIAADGPNGPLPCIYIEASFKPKEKAHKPGDGCCGPYVAPNAPVNRNSAGPGSQTPPYAGSGN